jgi:hypothetical protein
VIIARSDEPLIVNRPSTSDFQNNAIEAIAIDQDPSVDRYQRSRGVQSLAMPSNEPVERGLTGKSNAGFGCIVRRRF